MANWKITAFNEDTKETIVCESDHFNIFINPPAHPEEQRQHALACFTPKKITTTKIVSREEMENAGIFFPDWTEFENIAATEYYKSGGDVVDIDNVTTDQTKFSLKQKPTPPPIRKVSDTDDPENK